MTTTLEELKKKLNTIFEKDLVDEILEFAKVIEVKEGEVVLDYGKTITFMPLVLSGTLRVIRKDEEDKEILLYYLSDNESCAMAYACCMEAKKSEVKMVAEDEAEIIKLPHHKLDVWLQKYPSWKTYVFASFTHRFNELLKSLDSLAFHKLDQRLIKYLQNKSKVLGKNSLLLSHNQIAEELGTSRVVISRLLKQLENDKKLVLYRNEIKLLSSFGPA
ncbi:MAG: Crp/Fnr family transcriptional regulator [Bacteroidetes bacterium]|jgi:CRP/FNR family transcriptional regulator|nr:Crp/Fnr family transcriptional regulator [Bacteroidota bacterium]